METKGNRSVVGLCMIVKNEIDVIARCLESVKPLIDRWTIVDTGSTDGTMEKIRLVMANIPGELHERPWIDFGTNRTEAIQLARPHCDYLFIIDADEVLQVSPDFQLPQLKDDSYSVTILHGSIRYARTCLIAARLPWVYKGVLHEYLDAGRYIEPTPLPGLSVLYTTEGARSKNPRKFHDDALVFEHALKDDPDNLRYLYYLAQSYRDAGETASAIKAYQHRASLKGWVEEDWHAQYQVARLMDSANYPEPSVVNAYMKAYEMRPTRAESLVWLGAYLRHRNRWQSAKLFLLAANQLPYPTDRLFVEPDCYGWRKLDELALTYFYTGEKQLAKRLWQLLLDARSLPNSEVDRVQSNSDACD